MKNRRDWAKEHDEVLPLLPEATEELKKFPGVVAVEIGIKETGNDLTDDLSFRVYVTRKKPPGELAPDEKIPDRIFGVKTDVIELDVPVATSDDSKHRPLTGGIQLANEENSTGTLGCIARFNGDNSIVALSNSHVLMGNGASGLIDVGQPKIAGSCCCTCDDIGTVLSNTFNGTVDCAIARLKAGISGLNQVRALNNDGSAGTLAGSTAAVVSTDIVRKVGCTSDRTRGTITSITHPTVAFDSTPARTNQILVRPDTGVTRFQDFGDSGSVLVDANDRVVGLMWGAYLTPGSPLFGNGIACPIADVLTALNITIINGPLTSLEFANPKKTRVEVSEDADGQHLIDKVQARLSASDEGKLVLALIEQHRYEVLDLINQNRRVMVTWHRMQGPAFLAALGRSVKVPSYRIPTDIEGVDRRQAVIALLKVLAEEGSEKLRSVIEEHLSSIPETLAECTSVEEVIQETEKLVGAKLLVTSDNT